MLRLETPNLHEIGLDRVIAYGHTLNLMVTALVLWTGNIHRNELCLRDRPSKESAVPLAVPYFGPYCTLFF